jgi:hypothetical protein
MVDGKHSEKYFFDDIQKVEIHEFPNREPGYIKLFLKPKMIVPLGGFENMDRIIEHIEHRILDKSLIPRKQSKIYWDNSLLFVLLSVLTLAQGFILINATQGFSEQMSTYFFVLFLLWQGVYYLLYKPSLRGTIRILAKFDNVFSTLLIAGLIPLFIQAVLFK